MSVHPQEHLILGFLLNKERHGYEIHHHFSAGLGRFWHAGISQVYALLKRLEASKKVVSTVESQDNRPAKHIYSITPTGREAFLEWVHAPLERIRDLRLDFIAKLFFMRDLKLPGIDELIRGQDYIFQAKLEDIKQKDTNCADEFEHLVFQFRIAQIKAAISWLQDCKQNL